MSQPWQAFVPMGGSGQRFVDAGYAMPKPLIDVDGRSMLAHLLADLAGCERLICAVHAGHLQTTPIAAEILRLRPDARIVPVEPHKDGPIRTLLDAADAVDPDLPLLLHYADFATGWDLAAFRARVDERGWDAALDAYTGHFPHLGGATRYAGIRANGDQVLEIREKHCFTERLQDGWHSAGSYWVRRGGDLLRVAAAMVADDQRVAGEFFASTALGRLVTEGASVGLFPLQHFHQWGTPEDLRTWQSWQRGLGRVDAQRRQAREPGRSAQLVLMAGRGQRFVAAGVAIPKPFVQVAGEAMVAAGVHLWPRPITRHLVVRADDAHRVAGLALEDAPLTELALDAVTAGQAITADLGLAQLPPAAPVLVAACDAGLVLDLQDWHAVESRDDVDLVVFTAPWHQPAHWRPQSYGWVVADASGRITQMAVKQPVAGVALADQQVVTGAFWTPRADQLRAAIAELVAADERVGGEFYLDSVARRLVAAGARVQAMPVDLWMSWGTPQEVADFAYWNGLFRAGRDWEG